jgi:S-DNA-T family DNA segregation ATPase FtsK/SpoIIIE
VGAVLADQVTPAWCDRMARALAPVRDVSRDDDESMIPTSVRLLDLLHLTSPSAADVQSVWRAGGRTTSVPIGVSADGVFSVDLRVDGPHGLIAGTTGAGKSELLQTLIASLAVANRPDEMTFVLIDYKGGAAFADCASLPHVVGMVTSTAT